MHKAVISALASYLPERVLTNKDLAAQFGTWTAEQIFEKTGIRSRHRAGPDECASDLAVKAAQKLIDSGRLDPQEVDYLLFCTQAPDHYLPTTACLIQDRLKLPRSCGALDFNLGCSGYVYGLSLAKGLIESSQARCVLLLTAETYSKYINSKDRSVCTVFGDGAAATVLRAAEGAAGLDQFIFGSDGRGGRNLIVQTGGMRCQRTEETAQESTDADGNVRSANDLYMNGREIFLFAIQAVPVTINSLLEKAGLGRDDIDFFVFHQATRYMLDELVRKCKLPPDRVPYAFEMVGNTVSSTIPLVLEDLILSGRIKTGHRLMLVGFGVGYSWAGGIVRW